MNGNTENSLPIKPVKSRVFIVAYVRGLALIDMLLGTIAIMMIMGVLLTAISLQLTQVARLARNTRIYMLLDGEMEYLRSLSGPSVRSVQTRAFHSRARSTEGIFEGGVSKMRKLGRK